MKLAFSPPMPALVVWVRLTPVMVTTAPTGPLIKLKLVIRGSTRPATARVAQRNEALRPHLPHQRFQLGETILMVCSLLHYQGESRLHEAIRESCWWKCSPTCFRIS